MGGQRARDRHGRGLRTPVVPDSVPLFRTRSGAFDALVLAAVERLEPSWADTLDEVDIVVLDVPPDRPADGPGVMLGRAIAKAGAHRARLVVYRRPIELRAGDRLAELVNSVVVEQVAAMLGREPHDIDPSYDE